MDSYKGANWLNQKTLIKVVICCSVTTCGLIVWSNTRSFINRTNKRWYPPSNQTDSHEREDSPCRILHIFPNSSTFVRSNISIDTSRTILQRTSKFIKSLEKVRSKIRSHESGDITTKEHSAKWPGPIKKTIKLWTKNDMEFKKLAKYRNILTVILPWLTNGSNILREHYFTWSSDDRVCTWVIDHKLNKNRLAYVYTSMRHRSIQKGLTPIDLEPVYFHAQQSQFFGKSKLDQALYHRHFHQHVPDHVTYLNIIQNGAVNDNGQVITRDLKIDLDFCIGGQVSGKLGDVRKLPYAPELLVLTQPWGGGFFHMMLEDLPRISPYITFLRKYTEIKIHVKKVTSYLNETLRLFGIEDKRLVTGNYKASIVYLPRPTHCGKPWPFETQLLSMLYHKRIDKTHTRNLVILIRRSKRRYFKESKEIETVVRRATQEYGLELYVFRDDPPPGLKAAMLNFYRALIVVAPHGAGLSNLVYSQPGTYVIEGVCNPPHVNLCYQWTSHILGHHYHALGSNGGCEKRIEIEPRRVDDVLRYYLQYVTEPIKKP